MNKPGILALQGCLTPHIDMFAKLDVSCVEVKTSAQLKKVDRLIIPGGESSTMLKLLKKTDIFDTLKEFASKHPVWGICAGAILLSKEVENPVQDSLELIPVKATRNFYGAQLDSFKANIKVFEKNVDVDFIRAPRLEALSPEVEILSNHNEHSVLLKYGNILVSAFHTELGKDPIIHEYFLNLNA